MRRTRRALATALGLFLALGAFATGCGDPDPLDGEATLDLSAYADPPDGGRPVEAVVRRRDGAAARPPNVVVILADDLGYGDLGANGNAVLRTPNLDRLAREGVRFTDFYASAPTCSPSRAGLLTGRYPLRTGINFPIQPGTDRWSRRLGLAAGVLSAKLGITDTLHGAQSAVRGLPAAEITLAEALRVAGYETALVGKWHLGDFPSDPRYHPVRHGFDVFAGVPASNDNFPYSYWEGERQVEADLGLAQGELTAELTRQAVAFIERPREQPFFLYLAHKNVHSPLLPGAAHAGRSAAGPYGDLVEELDASVGAVLAALERRGLAGDTLVVFSSDNGPWHQGSAAPLRGRKGQPLEGGQRVPAIFAWPGTLPAGRVVSAPAMNFDVFPTVLALAGLDGPSDRVVDGRDLWPLLRGETEASPHEALFFFNANVIDGVRSGRWKYYRFVNLYTWPMPLDKPSTLAGRMARRFRYTDPRSGATAALLVHEPLLFDLLADPGESYDVHDRQAAAVADLQARIERWEDEFRANPRGWR
jgi:uncharacterized sulfatase